MIELPEAIEALAGANAPAAEGRESLTLVANWFRELQMVEAATEAVGLFAIANGFEAIREPPAARGR